MRVLRVKYRERVFYARQEDDHLKCLDSSFGSSPIPLEEVIILPPVSPSKIIGVGLNYHAHAKELNMAAPEEPIIFFKPPSAVIGGFGESILIPAGIGRVDYEAELALVMGRACHNVLAEDVRSYIFGYTCANDVTARDLQKKDGQWTRCKSFDTFAPLGPWLESEVDPENQFDPTNLEIRTLINGQEKQYGNTSDMIFSPFELVSFISKIMTLHPGDVILTGTPAGIGPITPGDVVNIIIEGVGEMQNGVSYAKEQGSDDLYVQ